ncbi:DUF4179 domain-containing protein [Paenibacillus sp.]|jgi:hypothetical protein|uniref:DUF4179 domain-containing protein n=1 Tax=Paenibacillus sp. TaxID=58172 RepID=UPI0028331568|nr:DUF4179 domain-containing protein [Paenibacillus sp.]MDR0267307.1 DUF4179 domain-containing protein [Paenibacillus sp.]
MNKQAPEEKVLAQQLGGEGDHTYPDFDAMWLKIEVDRQQEQAPTVVKKTKRTGLLHGRRLAFLSSLAFVIIATPVLASMSGKWDFTFRPGLKSALNQGFGQTLNKSVTESGVTFTINSAMSDDNGTTLLYSFDPKDKQARKWGFSEVELRKPDGEKIAQVEGGRVMDMNWKKGRYSLTWDSENKQYNGFLETPWTFSGLETDVQFIARGLQEYLDERVPLNLDPSRNGIQTFPIKKDGIDALNIEVVDQGAEGVLIKSSLIYMDKQAANTTSPRIQVMKDGKLVKSEWLGVAWPGTDGVYESRDYYSWKDINQKGFTFDLVYLTEGQKIDGEWNVGTLNLNKEKALNASATRELNIPFETSFGTSKIRKLIIRPTGIRIEVETPKASQYPTYQDTLLSISGRKLQGYTAIGDDDELESDMKTLMFDVPPDLHITPDTPMELILQNEKESKLDYAQPVLLKNISGEKQTVTSDVEGYPVKWTYYKANGKLYVETNSANGRFGGVNQTYYKQGSEQVLSRVVYIEGSTPWVSNERVNVFPGFEGTELELYIKVYHIWHPDLNFKLKLQ